MHLTTNPYALILATSGVATIIMSLIIFSRLKSAERSFALVIGLAGWWAISYSAELWSNNLTTMLFWLKLEYIGIAFLSPALAFFIKVFTSNQKFYLKPPHSLIAIIPIITVYLVSTNDVHHLYYKSISIEQKGAFPTLKIQPYTWYYIFTTYFYAILAWTIFSLIKAFQREDQMYKKQKNIILYAVLIPWIVNILYKLGLGPDENPRHREHRRPVHHGPQRAQSRQGIPTSRRRIFPPPDQQQ